MPDKNSVSRRSVVKGAAWSVPAVAASAAIPAFAASFTCNNVNAVMVAASAFHWGTVGAGKTRQQLQLFGRMQITGIPKDGVDNIKVEYVVQQRANGTSQPGAPTPTASGTDWAGTHTVSGTQFGMTAKGASGAISNPATGVTAYFPPAGTNG